MAENYFTCTLGQAKHCRKTKAQSISEFLETQANQYAARPAVGFASLAEKPANILTFYDLNELSKDAARGLTKLIPKLKTSLGQGHTAALLAHSNAVFLRGWLGLIRLGFSVLLLAPQLDTDSIEHLCGEIGVEYLLYDSDHASTAVAVQGLICEQLESDKLARKRKDDPEIEFQIGLQGKVPLVPYFHHSSGTSSGKPKAIAQSNFAAFAALPSIVRSDFAATFSSTPLYHGGVADCFRSWTSGQMIWLFPGGQGPVIAQTILTCLRAAEEFSFHGSEPPIKYFSSVPYVLQDIAASEEGMCTLRRMDIVGAGGAAFPLVLGQELVRHGVNLVSRYGSAECGFLLSSYRDFQNDKEWDYLRCDTGAEYLCFEPHVSGLFELVVKPGWPHMAKKNRMDGSYATADLFEKHPTKPNAWRYHSRADAQINLVNGKKFDPEPMESEIVSRCSPELILDVLVFGDGKSYPGALIFARNGQASSTRQVLDRIWPIIHEVNQHIPSYARLSKGMLRVILRAGEETRLEKSSKGTILRQKAHERYHAEINQMYDEQSTRTDLQCSIHGRSDLVAAVARLVEENTGKCLAADDDFFKHGIDSVACIQIQGAISKLIASTRKQSKNDLDKSLHRKISRHESNGVLPHTLFDNIGELPTNLLYQCGTIGEVADYLLGQSTLGEVDDCRLMVEFTNKYSHFGLPDSPAPQSPKTEKRGLVFLLTGATGALGTHVLDLLRLNSDVERIYCLLRASDAFVAYQRVDKALKSKDKDGLSQIGTVNKKIVCLSCNLAQIDLGLEKSMLQAIISTVDVIIHAAWAVNFTLRLKSFEFHLAGIHNLLKVGWAAAAAQHPHPHSLNRDLQERPVKFAFCSSIASVSASNAVSVPEKISEGPADASPLGYSRSKWVAESICANAHRTAQEASIPLKVEVLRIGQLCGDTNGGIWNKTEAWPLMLSTFDLVGCLPDLPGERLDWLPLDTAASAVCESAFDNSVVGDSRAEPQVYHILNPHTLPSWAQMLSWLQEREGENLRVVNLAEWLGLLDTCLMKDHPQHPSRKLLSWWKDTYLSRPGHGNTKPEFEVVKAAGISDNIRSVRPLSRRLIEKIWVWIRRNIPVDGQGAGS